MESPPKTRKNHQKHKNPLYSSTSQRTRHTNDRNNPEQCHVEIYCAPPRIMRTELLCSPEFKSALNRVTNELHFLCSQGREAEQDLFLQRKYDFYTNLGKVDLAYAILALRNIYFVKQSRYNSVLDRFQNQLKMLESCDTIQNRPFIKAGFCQKIARVFLRLDQPGSAFEWLRQAQMELQHAEACEWTGYLLHSMGATTTCQYFAQIASPRASDIRKGAYHYYKKSYEHFRQEKDSDTGLNLIQMLKCMFNALVNIYLFKDIYYHIFFQNRVPIDNLQTAEKILSEIRARFIALDHWEHCYENLMDILVNQATLMMRKTQYLSCLEDQLYSVSSLILQAQSDFDAFNQMVIKVLNSHTGVVNGYSSYIMEGKVSHTVETNDSSFHTVETNDSSYRTVETNDSSSHTVETNDSSYHTVETNDSSYHTVETNDSSYHTVETNDSSSHTVETNYSSYHTEETNDSSYHTEETNVSSCHTDSSSHTVETNDSCSDTVETNDSSLHSNDSNSHMIQQCHMVYYQLHVCIASFIHYLITPHSTEDLQEALDHLQICPILQNILLDAIKYRSDDVVPKEKECPKTEAESSPTENNLATISDLSSVSGPENTALTEPE